MGLFSKEACCFCGKEVGVMSRSKLTSGEYVCTECKYLTNPFLRLDHMNREQVEAVMKEMEESEQKFQSIEFRKTAIQRNGKAWIFYDSWTTTGEFAVVTPETAKYKYHCVLDMDLVRPFDKMLNADRLPKLTVSQVRESITLTEKKDASGNLSERVLHIPYFRNDMNIEMHFPTFVPEKELGYFYNSVANILSRWVEQSATRKKMQVDNMSQTIGNAVMAAVKGEGEEGIAKAIEQGLDKSQAIDEGKVKKKGLLGTLFGKKG